MKNFFTAWLLWFWLLALNTLAYPHPGNDLKDVLEEIGISQSDLAKYARIANSRISEISSSGRTKPFGSTCRRSSTFATLKSA